MERFQNTGQPDWDWWGRLWPAPGETLRALGLASGTSLVEIGCGNGYFAIPAARIVDPSPVFALDLDDAVLEDLQTTADKQGIENLVPIQGDARDLSTVVSDPVDAATVLNTFHGVDDHERFVQEVYQTVRPGGRFVIVNWHDRPRAETTIGGEPRGPPTELRMTPESTIEVVTHTAGFELEQQVDLPPYHYGLVFERSD